MSRSVAALPERISARPVVSAASSPADGPALVVSKWRILSSVSLGTFMATLDGTIVNLALPSIRDAFRVDLTAVGWVSLAYLLVAGCLLLPVGRLGEVLTFRQVYVSGLAVFAVASTLCGLAPSFEALIGLRVVQATGAAMLQAMGTAIVARTFGPGERGRALGLNAISVSIALSLGPTLGGLLTQIAGWRTIFVVNLPVAVLAMVWAHRVLPTEVRVHHGSSFDWWGAGLSAVGLFSLLLAMSQGQTWGWASPAIVGLGLGAAASAIAFVLVESRRAEPLLDLSLFRIRAFAAGNVSMVIAFAALFAATFLLPFLLENGDRVSPLEIGLLLTPIPIAMALVAPLSGVLSDRIGPRLPASLGLATLAAGLANLTGLPPTADIAAITWRLVLIGLGMGLFVSPNGSAVLGAVPRRRLGTASATLAQMRVGGQAIGIAFSSAVVAIRLPAHLAELGAGAAATSARTAALVLAINDAFRLAAIVCTIGVGLSLIPGRAQLAESLGSTDNAPMTASAGRSR
jgi:EmrB/QacA subfamily drug resistance transporter